ncbi:MAG TPA: hypothetical protein VIA18_23070, partial [Polyangia bacterium]|nr:hypothetical protein [Polyangia bacterium]
MRVFSKLKQQWLALSIMAATALPGVAHAQALSDTKGCFTPVGGINGLAPDIAHIDNGGLLDSRWTGGFGYGWETGGLGEGEFKAVSDGNYIYLSTRHYILKDAIGGSEGVQLGVAYTPSGSTSLLSQIIRVTFGVGGPGDTYNTPSTFDSTANAYVGTPPLTVSLWYKKDQGTTTSWQPAPVSSGDPLQWVYDSTRMFIFNDSALVTTTNPNGLYYVVQMRIPIKHTSEDDPSAPGTHYWTTPGVYADTTQPIKYWADLMQTLDPQADAVIFRSWPDPGLSSPTMPNYSLQNRDGAGGTTAVSLGTPDPASAYSTMQYGSPAAGTCSGTGLGFANTDIQDLSAVAAGHSDGNLLLYSTSGSTTNPTITSSPNSLRVNVTNSSSTPYTPSDI